MQSIALIDCNNFFVSCERVFRPDLEGKAVIVLSSNDGCAIARSNEAKALGIAMGEPWYQIQANPKYRQVISFSSNFALYADMSNRVMKLLAGFSPAQEVYSIDESFLDLTGFTDIRKRSYAIRAQIARALGLPACVGIGPTKTLAKIANHVAKRHPKSTGVFNYNVLTDEQKEKLLASIPVEEIWGIGRRLAASIQAEGILTVADLRLAPAKSMRGRYGVTMERLIGELNGKACLEMVDVAPAKQQILSSRSFGKAITAFGDLANAVAFFAGKVAGNLRQQDSTASMVHVFIQTDRFRESARQYHPTFTVPLPVPASCSTVITKAALDGLREIFRKGYEYRRAGVSVSEISGSTVCQMDLFEACQSGELSRVMDAINDRFGPGTVRISQDDPADRHWAAKREKMSPRYTTAWDELPVCR